MTNRYGEPEITVVVREESDDKRIILSVPPEREEWAFKEAVQSAKELGNTGKSWVHILRRR